MSPRERAYPGDKPPKTCDLACCGQWALRTTTLRSGQVILLCDPHAEALAPPPCDCKFYLMGAGVLGCNRPLGHTGSHQHPHAALRWSVGYE